MYTICIHLYALVYSCILLHTIILRPLLTCNLRPSHFQTAPKIFGGNLKTHLLAFFSGEADNYDTIMTNLKDTASEFKGKVSKFSLLALFLSSCVPHTFLLSSIPPSPSFFSFLPFLRPHSSLFYLAPFTISLSSLFFSLFFPSPPPLPFSYKLDSNIAICLAASCRRLYNASRPNCLCPRQHTCQKWHL